jgi:hypothetical protein
MFTGFGFVELNQCLVTNYCVVPVYHLLNEIQQIQCTTRYTWTHLVTPEHTDKTLSPFY